MNIVMFVLAALIGGLQVNDPASHRPANVPDGCITADRIIKPIRGWNMVKKEIKIDDKLAYLEISMHNPLNKKTPESVDARFVLSIDPVDPSDATKYSLSTAFYYNTKTNVAFKRIYSVENVTVKDKVEKRPMLTPCFARQVIPIIRFDSLEIKVPEKK